MRATFGKFGILKPQALDCREHLPHTDGLHAARLGAFVGRALAAPHPADLALEQRDLVAAGAVPDRHAADWRIAPELSRPEHHLPRPPAERDLVREGQLAGVRD